MLHGGGPHPAFAFRWGAVVFFDASPAERDAVLRQLDGCIANPLGVPLEETAWMQPGEGFELTERCEAPERKFVMVARSCRPCSRSSRASARCRWKSQSRPSS